MTKGTKATEYQALIDCGAEGRFIDKSIVNWRKARKLKTPLLVKNVDRTINKAGQITHQVWMEYTINGNTMGNWFFISSLGDQTILLGLPWLKEYNPHINWSSMIITMKQTWRDDLILALKRNKIEKPDDQELLIHFIASLMPVTTLNWDNKEITEEEIWIQAKQAESQMMESKYHTSQETVTLPEIYTPWAKVFEKEASEQFPGTRKWDHKIELDNSFEPQNPKPYPLSPAEQNSLDAWITEQTAKGYIEKKELPHASPFFFVSKKDRGLRPCQDY
jgi:hypothetical protein